jgi:hypothetical protein
MPATANGTHCLLPGQFEEFSILDPRRAYGLARATPYAPIDVELKSG